MINLAILASGSGTNAENIGRYFLHHKNIKVLKILSNKADAYVHERASKLSIPSEAFSRSQFRNGELLHTLSDCDYLILAGFLWLIPPYLLEAFPDKIINIHPALLPKYGGKGMYGMKVHHAVIENEEKESGITIHLVNEKYDEGKILYQARCEVDETDTPDSLATKIHELEYTHFPRSIENYILSSKP